VARQAYRHGLPQGSVATLFEHPCGTTSIRPAWIPQRTPCPINFPFIVKEGEWKAADQGWGLIQYNEDMGTVHNGAQLQLATLLARKPD